MLTTLPTALVRWLEEQFRNNDFVTVTLKQSGKRGEVKAEAAITERFAEAA